MSFIHKHRKIIWAVCILCVIGLIVLGILTALGLPPFGAQFQPVNLPGGTQLPWGTDPYNDPRVLKDVWQARGKSGEPPKPCSPMDPNGLAGSFSMLPAVTGNPGAAQYKLCEPAWQPGKDGEAGSLVGPSPATLPDAFWGDAAGRLEAVCSSVLDGASLDDEAGQKKCWDFLCGVPQSGGLNGMTNNIDSTSMSAEVQCLLNYWNPPLTGSRSLSASRNFGQPAGWMTGVDVQGIDDFADLFESDSGKVSSNLKALFDKAKSVCTQSQTTQALPLTTTKVDGIEIPQVPGASTYMQSALQTCILAASKDDVFNPVALCTDLVMRHNPAGSDKTAFQPTVNNPFNQGAYTYADWKDAWTKVTASQEATCNANGGGVDTPKDCTPPPEGWCVRLNGHVYGQTGTTTKDMTKVWDSLST